MRVGPAQPMPIVLPGRRTPAAASSSSIRIWWIGSASTPHGRGPVRGDVPGLGQLPPGRGGVLGQPAPARRAGAGRRRAGARSPCGNVPPGLTARSREGPSAAGHRVRSPDSSAMAAATGPQGERHVGVELRRRLGGRGAAGARCRRPGPGRPPRHVGRLRPPGQRRGPDAARRRRRRAGQGRAVPLQLPRVHGVGVRHLQGGPRPDQHELPLPRRGARLPLGQRRRRRRGVPRHLHRAHRGHPRPGPPGHHLALGRRRRRALPRRGPRRTRPPPRPEAPTRSRARGAAAATTCCCSTPVAPRACPRA